MISGIQRFAPDDNQTKLYDADDHDRWRKAKHELQEKCCGEVDSVGTCLAPACRQGEALRAMHEMLEYIDFSDGERKRLEAQRPSLYGEPSK